MSESRLGDHRCSEAGIGPDDRPTDDLITGVERVGGRQPAASVIPEEVVATLGHGDRVDDPRRPVARPGEAHLRRATDIESVARPLALLDMPDTAWQAVLSHRLDLEHRRIPVADRERSFDDQLGCRGEGDRDRRPVDFADVSGTNEQAGLEPMPAGAGKADSQQPPVAVGRRGNLLTIDARPGRIPTRLPLLPHRDQGAGVGIEIDRQLPSPLRPRQGLKPDGVDPHPISGPSAKGSGEDAIERLGNERRLAALLTAVSRPVPATEAGHDEHRE